MPSIVLQQLERFGPDHCELLPRDQAIAYTRKLVHEQYENFSVVSWLLPKRMRDDFAAVYAFCRWADDLGDETGDREQSLKLLSWWGDELNECYAGKPRHPVFIALHDAVVKHDIPVKLFEDLISAFAQDQRVDRYENWGQVLDYCSRSANPVGRLVLCLCGYNDPQRQQLSDATCTALQLANFWQDVRRDILERDRIYVPADVLVKKNLTHDDLTKHVRNEKIMSEDQMQAYREVIGKLTNDTRPLFQKGRELWPLIDRQTRTSVQLFSLGGEKVLQMIEQMNYNTLQQRPRLNKWHKAQLMGRALLGKVCSIGSGGVKR